MTNQKPSRQPWQLIAPLMAAGLVLLWAEWPVVKGMAIQWDSSPDYSHGWLVPILAVVILWSRRAASSDSSLALVGKSLVGIAAVAWGLGSVEHREWLSIGSAVALVVGVSILVVEWVGVTSQRASWWGLAMLAAGGCLQLAGAYYYFEWFERLAIIPLVMGCILMICGRRTFWWSLPATAFLVFMIPLPYRLEIALRDPLKSVGTSISTYLMQTLGMPAYTEGYVIAVNDARIGVVEACSGLRMLTVFLALSAALVVIVERPMWQKCLLLLGALPIALISNILRITVTGTCYAHGYDHLADMTFHDLAGWMMMPLGIAFLLVELWILDRLVVTEVDRPMIAGLASLAGPPKST